MLLLNMKDILAFLPWWVEKKKDLSQWRQVENLWARSLTGKVNILQMERDRFSTKLVIQAVTTFTVTVFKIPVGLYEDI